MIGKGAHEIRPATLSEVLKILEKRQGTGTGDEFGFEQQTSLEYAKRFAHLKFSDAEEMYKELVEMGMKTDAAAKVVDLLPKNKSQLMLILQKSELPDKKVPDVEALVEKFSKKAKKFEPKVLEAVVPEAPKEEKAAEAEPKEEKAEKKEA
jgi:DNA-directed RNA polymerase subunit F